MPFNFQTIEGVQVVLEKERTNQLVGVLSLVGHQFRFEYDKNYLRSVTAIPLGPEMPLTRRIYQSEQLFCSFADRIPSRENPAFSEYCRFVGISEYENNPLILLSSIASRGPSSFLFKPIYRESFTASDLKQFREKLGLSVREFALCFDFSQPGVTRVETGVSGGREILKRVELYALYPQVTLDQLRRRAAHLHRKKMERAIKWLKARLLSDES
ncbi:HipA N-terminal domain-containing protein [Simkania negevensis]|uniref:HipA N-terminal domain-containing protein n=1 Tax=Simkania negevensis TaxID=83561 RepID=A0ABS3AR80_9BACT|nr:HipA N-terminal domain-containing protein [Simkania negevensis]